MRTRMRISGRSLTAALVLLLLWSFASPAMAGNKGQTEGLKKDFQQFLPTYIQHVREKDRSFLATIHPELPEEMYDFFFDATLNMMRYARSHDLQPDVTCKDYGVCTVTWPQPKNSWAAQTFIRHEEHWRWLSE